MLFGWACTASDSTTGERVDAAGHVDAFATVNGVRLNYLGWRGDGPALILLHGSWASPHAFDAIAPLLAEHFHVVAFARRGHGQSDVPTQVFDLEVLVEDLRQLLDALGIERAHLLGWSFGGYEITRFAVKYPERTGKLVFLEAHYEFTPDEPTIPFPISAWEEAPNLGPTTEHLATVDAWLRDRLEILEGGQVRERRSSIVRQSLANIVQGPLRQYHLVQAPTRHQGDAYDVEIVDYHR